MRSLCAPHKKVLQIRNKIMVEYICSFVWIMPLLVSILSVKAERHRESSGHWSLTPTGGWEVGAHFHCATLLLICLLLTILRCCSCYEGYAWFSLHLCATAKCLVQACSSLKTAVLCLFKDGYGFVLESQGGLWVVGVPRLYRVNRCACFKARLSLLLCYELWPLTPSTIAAHNEPEPSG